MGTHLLPARLTRRVSVRRRLLHRGVVRPWAALAAALGMVAVQGTAGMTAGRPGITEATTQSPIQHLVVIFQENVSFDHYFGTYPVAANTSGEPFHASPVTPKVNNLADTPGAGGSGTLLSNNPNTDAAGNQVNPNRLDPASVNDILTCDQNHDYGAEQKAFDGGAMDKFITTVGTGSGKSATGQACNADTVMDYYDGNTVQAIWNYAQGNAMSDNSYDTTFGPSAPGAINLVSGDTGNVGITINGADTNGDTVSDGNGGKTLISDAQPYYDDCSTRDAASLTGTNVGDELNARGLSWGWFQGGFNPTTSFAQATATVHPGQGTATFIPDEFSGRFATAPASNQGICNAVHPIGAALGGTGTGATNYGYKDDYIAHHEPFQYYASTANPHHLSPASLAAVGTDTQSYAGGVPQFDTANHQYDISTFDALVGAIAHGYLPAGNLPAVSFLKASGYQDGHAGYSDPFDEQQFIARTVNELEATPDWKNTAVVIAYDDSDGFYDHAFGGIQNASSGSQDFLTGVGTCGNPTANPPLAGQDGRCGHGPRQPLMVISPWAKHNFVDHTMTDLSSVTAFVQQNWQLPQIPGSFASVAGSLSPMFNFNPITGGHNPRQYLDPTTGQPFNN